MVRKCADAIEVIEELSEEVEKVAWMLGINDTDLLALLLKIHAEGLNEDEILKELEEIATP